MVIQNIIIAFFSEFMLIYKESFQEWFTAVWNAQLC